MATALDAHVEQLDTFDGPLQRLNQTIGNPPLKIGPPDLGMTGTLESGIAE